MTDNELLLAISEIMDKKIAPVEHHLKSIELTLENNIIPRLQNIESCYTSTYDLKNFPRISDLPCFRS